jgi:hypothetical protein
MISPLMTCHEGNPRRCTSADHNPAHRRTCKPRRHPDTA